MNKIVIGTDVSKDRLDYVPIEASLSWSSVESMAVSSLANKEDAIEAWLDNYRPDESVFVFEPTGSYSDTLLELLVEKGYEFSLVTPQRAHAFSQTMQLTSKDDAWAARLLAYMGARLELPRYQPPSQEMKERKQVLAALSALMKQHQMLKNQLHAQEQYRKPQAIITQVFKDQIASIEKGIDQLKKQLKQLDDQAFVALQKLAMTVVGIGPATSSWLLILTQGLENFHTSGQLIKYCGLVGRTHRSGKSVNAKGGITKQACAKLRACLFMAARSAIRYNLACKELYQRLRAKGKPFFKAIVAVMAKLLKQLFGVIKSNTPFDNQYYLKYQKN